jgi:hypothetical protein
MVTKLVLDALNFNTFLISFINVTIVFQLYQAVHKVIHFHLFAEHCSPSIHLSFDKVSASTLLDDSGSGNNAIIANGAQIAPHSGKCGNAANLLGKIYNNLACTVAASST